MKTIVIYPGRFQPWHKGHLQVYKWLKKRFDTVIIATSDKMEITRSPFDFKEKAQMVQLTGVSPSNIIQVKNPYIATEILKNYDEKNTIVVFAVSEKDMKETPRFSFDNNLNGSNKKLQKYTENANEPFENSLKPKGYILTVPTFDFKVCGKVLHSATEIRNLFVNSDEDKQKEIITDLFGKYDENIYQIFKSKLKKQKSIKVLKEEINHKEFAPMVDSFVSFASDELGIKSLPNIKYTKQEDDVIQPSFGGYNPNTKEIRIVTKNRHPLDIFRTLAHELIHHKQNEDGKINDVQKEGSTGSDIENEANSLAGILMRKYGKLNPKNFHLKHVNESVLINEDINDPMTHVAVFLIGGPGSGKDFIRDQLGLTKEHGLKEINSDSAFEYMLNKHGLSFEMPDEEERQRNIVRGKAKNISKEQERLFLHNRKGIVVNGTGATPERTLAEISFLKSLGFKTMMIYVATDNKISKERNIQRGKDGGRTVPEKIRQEKWNEVDKAAKIYKQVLGNEFLTIENNYDLRTAPKEIKLHVLNEIDQISKKIGSLIRQDITHPEAIEWMSKRANEIGIENYIPPKALQGRYGNPIKNSGPAPEEYSMAKRLGLKYFGFGRYGKTINGQNKVTHYSQNGRLVAKPIQFSEEKEPCWKKYTMVGIKKKGKRKVPNCVPIGEGEEKLPMSKVKKVRRKLAEAQLDLNDITKREWGTDSLANIYKEMTPGQEQTKKKKIVIMKKPFPDTLLTTNGIGPTFTPNAVTTGLGFSYTIPMNEKVETWANDIKTQEMFMLKYGDKAKEMLEQRIVTLLNY